MAKVIYLSPSNHGENANLCLKEGCCEDKHTRPIAEACKKYLDASGFTTYIAAKDTGVKARCTESDKLGADWHIPIHTNAWKDPDTRYLLFMCYHTTGEHKKMFDAVAPYMQAIYPGNKTASFSQKRNLVEINTPKAKSFYCELGFHTNPTDVNEFIHNSDAVGKALAQGICKYYGVECKTSSTPTPAPAPAPVNKPEVTSLKKVGSKVVTASIKEKGKNYKLAEHFTLGEFQCRNGADTVKYDIQIVTALEAARTFFNVPITISSAYRTPDYNSRVGGAPGSYHTKGRAVDHYCKLSYTLLAKFYEVYGLKGIGCYYDDHFVHIDSRAIKFLWKNQSSTRVSTHLTVVRKGNKNQHVNDLQWLLKNKYGYKIAVDGAFGPATYNAVISFQKKYGLGVDGIVGKNTWTRLLTI